MPHVINGMPGIGTEYRAEARNVRRSQQGLAYFAGGVIIDGSKSDDPGNTGYPDVLRPGTLMGRITTGGKWRPSIIGVSTAAYADNDTTITVAAATATAVARLITVAGGSVSLKFVGPASAAGSIVSTSITVTAASGTTLTCGDLNVNKISGSWIMPADGSETPLGIIDDGSGVKVSDNYGTRADQSYGNLLIGGDLDSSQIIGWPVSTETTMIAQIKTWLNNASNYGFRFDDGFGM